jgi:SAM-dependent methyltransferase
MADAPHDPACPICAERGTIECLRQHSVPVHQHLPFASREAARNITRGEIDLRWCPRCGFAFNAAFQPELLQYGHAYDNSQTHSPHFEVHVDRLVQHLIESRNVRNCRIVEVGCGQGDFLRRLVRNPVHGNRGVGFDPAYRGPAEDMDARFRAHSRYFGVDTAVPADAVVTRHVIEHVPDPVAFLRDIALAMQRGGGQGRVFVETPDVEWILERQVIWDIFYEHCSLFTAHGLRQALSRAGFGEIRIARVFGEQYLWAEARLAASTEPLTPAAASLTCAAREFGNQSDRLIRRWSRQIEDLSTTGDIAVWGAGAKGVTFCHLTDPEGTRLSGLIDVNPGKQGKHIPGSGHRVHAPEDWLAHRHGHVLVLNPNYFEEIRSTIHALPTAVRPVNLMTGEAA